jgi:integrase/recombinase XerC
MVDKFLDYIKVEKRYSEHTLTSYKKDLEDFLSFVMNTEGSQNLVQVDKKVIRNFLVHLTKIIFKNEASIENSSLRSFYHFYSK